MLNHLVLTCEVHEDSITPTSLKDVIAWFKRHKNCKDEGPLSELRAFQSRFTMGAVLKDMKARKTKT